MDTVQQSRQLLIVYYSFEGSTKLIAETIATTLQATVLEIKPLKKMRTKGFMKYVFGGSQSVMHSVPKLEKIDISLDKYETIIIGTPVWASDYSPPIRAFLTQTKLQSKNIAIFCTHKGCPGHALDNLKNVLGGNTIIAVKDFPQVVQNHDQSIVDARTWAEDIKETVTYR